MAETKESTKWGLYNSPNLSVEIIKTAAERDVNILNTEEAIQKSIREEKRMDDKAEKERKERLDKEARERADSLWQEMKNECKCCWFLALTPKKLALVALVIFEFMVLLSWVHNPADINCGQLIAAISLVVLPLLFIILLGRYISKEDGERAKQKAELEKEVFMRRLK